MSAVTLPAPSPIVQIPNGDPGVAYREVAGFPGYAVGDDGSIWSALTRLRRSSHGHIGLVYHRLVPDVDNDGYQRIEMKLNGKPRRRRLHTLVLTAFVGPRPTGMEARHFPDRDRTNNRLSNLQWGSRLENVADKTIHDTHPIGERHGSHKVTESDVRAIRRRHSLGELQRTLASEFGIDRVTVSNIVTRQTWKHVT